MPTNGSRPIRYPDGQEVRFGDLLRYGDHQGTVVAHAGSSKYDPRFPREEWERTLDGGFLIEFENGALLRLDECDEDTQLLGRSPGPQS